MFISTLLSRVVILTAGTLYPVYRSYKAVRTKDVKEYVKWMMYWIVFGIFCAGEAVADILLSFWTRGASILYRNWVHPMFMKHEEEIDTFLEQAKNESYKQVVSLGTRSLACARDIVATAALRGAAFGHVQLADLHRSYSTGDINNAGKGGEVRKRTTTTVVSQKQATALIEEEEEFGNDEAQVRTWTGSYDELGRVVEYPVLETTETLKNINDEEIVVIEDPIGSKPRRSGSSSRRSRRNTRRTPFPVGVLARQHARVTTTDEQKDKRVNWQMGFQNLLDEKRKEKPQKRESHLFAPSLPLLLDQFFVHPRQTDSISQYGEERR
uniref:Receptor expression-enhancing protein n=1 Tax=Globodera pallida TaxID=36090 RepID=A0A183BM76_GLOPA